MTYSPGRSHPLGSSRANVVLPTYINRGDLGKLYARLNGDSTGRSEPDSKFTAVSLVRPGMCQSDDWIGETEVRG